MSAFERTLKYLIVSYRIVSCCDRRRQRVTGISGAPCAISSTLTMSCSAQHPCFIIIPHSSHSHSFASPNLSPCVLTMHPPNDRRSRFVVSPMHRISSCFIIIPHFLHPPSFASPIYPHPCFICVPQVIVVHVLSHLQFIAFLSYYHLHRWSRA